MTTDIKKLIRKKHRAYKTSKKYDTPKNKVIFKKLRKLVQQKMHNSKTEYLKGLLEVPDKSDEVVDHTKHTECPNYRVGKKFWSYIKSMRTNGSGIDTLVVGNKEIHDAKGKAQALSNQYCSVYR